MVGIASYSLCECEISVSDHAKNIADLHIER